MRTSSFIAQKGYNSIEYFKKSFKEIVKTVAVIIRKGRKMQRVLCVLTAFLLFCLFNDLPFSYSASGEEVYKTKCGSCHGRGGQAPDISPAKFASIQWRKFFERNKHARKTDIRSEISPSEKAAVMLYLMDHAADSDLPISTGIR